MPLYSLFRFNLGYGDPHNRFAAGMSWLVSEAIMQGRFAALIERDRLGAG